MNKHDTVLGISENLVAVLCYAGFWLTGIIFLAWEQKNKFVRFHALQSLITFLIIFVLSIIFSIIPIIGWFFSVLLTPISIVLWLFLMYQAFSGQLYKLPVIGDLAEEQIFDITDNEVTIDVNKRNKKEDND